MIEKNLDVVQGNGYGGLTFEEVQWINDLFNSHRHLVNPKLRKILSGIHEDFIWLSKTSNQYDKTEEVVKDLDRKFLDTLIRENEFHLKRIGFYSDDNK